MHELETKLHDLGVKLASNKMISRKRIAEDLMRLATESHWYLPPKRKYIRRLPRA